jgi:hypothetical protein
MPIANGTGSANADSIAEFPLSTVSILGRRLPIAGGGYFRLLPYAVTRRAIRHLNVREHQPAIVYLHPWEIDAHQPAVRVNWFTQFRHSVNIASTEVKLRRLLKGLQIRSGQGHPGEIWSSHAQGRALKIAAVVGARPNFVKIAPIVAELRTRPEATTMLIHTGQHYDGPMSDAFSRISSCPIPT